MNVSAPLMDFQPKYADNMIECDTKLRIEEDDFLQNVGRDIKLFVLFNVTLFRF